MKSVLVFSVFLVATVISRPNEDPGYTRVEVRDAYGQYSYQYKTGSGTLVQEQGALKRADDGKSNIIVAKGQYEYTSPEGKEVAIKYTADERGYVPSGDVIPTQQDPVAGENDE